MFNQYIIKANKLFRAMLWILDILLEKKIKNISKVFPFRGCNKQGFYISLNLIWIIYFNLIFLNNLNFKKKNSTADYPYHLEKWSH